MKHCPSCQAAYPSDYTHCPRDGSSLTTIGEWAEGRLVRGKYRILAKVGQGGMASVYKAVHVRFKETRALKVISRELASDANFVRRFEQEALITRKLQHPNAVRVEDIDEAEDGRPFIVMEFVEGSSLKDVIEQEAPMAVERVVSIVKQAASALEAAHTLGLVHRDVKPGNIALVPAVDANGAAFEQVKILDFGIVKLKEARLQDGKTQQLSYLTLTDTGVVIGTPAYMSPEQARGMKGDEVDGRSDTYSLGIVTYQMLTGELPLKAESTIEQLMAHLSTPPKPIRELRPDIPNGLATVVMRCLEKNRELRPASGQALIAEIQSAMSQPLPLASPLPLPSASASSSPLPSPPLHSASLSLSAPITLPPQVMQRSAEQTETVEQWPLPEPVAQRRTTPAHPWLWVIIVAFVLAALGSIAYLRRGQNAALQGGASSPPVIARQATPPEVEDAHSIPSPPASPAPMPAAPEAKDVRPTTAVRNAVSAVQGSPKPTLPNASSAGAAEKSSTPARVPESAAGRLPTSSPLAKPENSSTPVPAASASHAPDTGAQGVPPTPTAGPAAARPAASAGTPMAGGTPSPTSEVVAVYRVGGGVSAPSIISAPSPDYTDEARRARKEGNCVLSLVVDTAGRARNLRVVSPLGFGLDEKAIEAVQHWRFQPGLKDGKPVNVQMNIEVEFRQY